MKPETRRIKDACQVVTQAINDLIAVHGWAGSGVVTDWVLVTGQGVFDDDGDLVTSYSLFMKDGSIPHHRAIGLLHVGLGICADHGHDNPRAQCVDD